MNTLEFIAFMKQSLQYLIDLCNKTTSGNVSHNIANLKQQLIFCQHLIDDLDNDSDIVNEIPNMKNKIDAIINHCIEVGSNETTNDEYKQGMDKGARLVIAYLLKYNLLKEEILGS